MPQSLNIMTHLYVTTLLLACTQNTVKHGEKYANSILEKVRRGEEPGEVQGMLEQWLREKKMSTEFSLVMASGMLTAGIHTVSVFSFS